MVCLLRTLISAKRQTFFNEEYCKWCYADGEYLYHNMDDLIEVCVQNMANEHSSSEQARIYDDRLLVKPVKSAVSLMSDVTYELPYEGAKEMLLVDDVDNREFLKNLFCAMYEELPLPKKKK